MLDTFERKLRKKGFSLVAGVDEAGRGALAGPLAAAAVILPQNPNITGLKESKQASVKERKQLFQEILQKAICWQIAWVESSEIDKIGLQQANFKALTKAANTLSTQPDYVLCDGFSPPEIKAPSLGLKKGDILSPSIAAASIIAKVLRDKRMYEVSSLYPSYSFCQHKGYGTAHHREALRKFGPSPIHRKSFKLLA